MSEATGTTETAVAVHPTAEQPSKRLTTKDVANILQMNATTIINWSESGKIKFFATPGGHRRYEMADVLAFAKEYGFPVGGAQ